METPFAPDQISREWGSHLPALIACVAASDGPVLEIGCGHYSTPCLHALCEVLGKQLVTLEECDSWRNQFNHFRSHAHRIQKQTEEELSLAKIVFWGVVFVDDLAAPRVERAKMFFDYAEFIVMHDANFPQFQPALNDWMKAQNCHSFLYDTYSPHTLIISKTREIPEFA